MRAQKYAGSVTSRRVVRKLLCFAGAVLLFTAYSSSFAIVCRRAGIGGYDSQYEAAHKVLSAGTTTDLSSCEIYVTREGTNIYAHSNYLSIISGEDPIQMLLRNNRPERYDYPTKIVEPVSVLQSLDDITNNIVADSEVSLKQMSDEIATASEDFIKYFLDPTMFEDDGSLTISIGRAGNLFISDPNAPPPRRLHPTRSSRGPPWMAEIGVALMMKVRAPFAPLKVIERLQRTPVKKKRFRLVSLINDLSTEIALKQSSISSSVEYLPSLTTASIKEVFRKNSRGVLAILGHVEGDRFLLKDASGKNVLLEIPVDTLRTLAAEFRCDLIYLGCSAGREGGGIGAANPFNPVYAVQRLAEAMAAANYYEFVEKLAGDRLSMVLDETAFSQAAANTAAELKFETFVADDASRSPDSPVVGGFVLNPVSSGPVWMFVTFILIALALLIAGLFLRHFVHGGKRPAN